MRKITKKLFRDKLFLGLISLIGWSSAIAQTNSFIQQSVLSTNSIGDRLGNSTVGDFNGDGWKDILATDEATGQYRCYLNDGAGNFATNVFTYILTGVTWKTIESGDLDNDGDLDLVASNGRVYINNGSASFTQLGVLSIISGTGTIGAIKIKDMNLDGKLDIIWGNSGNGVTDNNEVWLNTGTPGNANFVYSTGFNNILAGGGTSDIDAGDIDGDGDLDIVKGSISYSSEVFKNNGSGTFVSSQLPTGYGGGVRLVDWDQDNDLDIVAYERYNASLTFRRNDGTGTFANPIYLFQNYGTNRAEIGDLNGDGLPDVVIDRWGGQAGIFINTGFQVVLQTSPEMILGNSSHGVKIADFNNDGKLDVFCAGRDAISTTWKNDLNILPTPPTAPAAQTFCNSATVANLVATGTAIKWYDAPINGNLLTASTPLVSGTIYYVSQTINSNEGFRTAVTATIITSAAPVAASQAFCNSATVANLVATGTAIKWYDAATNGNLLASSTPLVSGSIYYASQTIGSCESARTAVTATITVSAAPTVTTPITYNVGAAASALTATGTGLLWYPTATGETGTTIAPTPSTATNGTTSYWVSQTTSACESTRTQIDVVVTTAATHLNFDGVNDQVNLGNSLSSIIDPLNTITLEAWVRPTTLTGFGCVFGNYAYPTDNGQMQLLLRREGSSYDFYVNDGTGSLKNVAVVNSAVLNTWTHVAGVWDGSSLKMYINGVLQATTTGVTGSSFAALANSFVIGFSLADNPDEAFKGDIDEVRVWNRALTQAEIANNMNCELPNPTTQTGLLAYYQFNQGSDAVNNAGVTSITDSSVAASNGTLANFGLTGATSNWISGSPIVTGVTCSAPATHLNFDGVNDNVVLTHFNRPNDMTIEAMIKTTSTLQQQIVGWSGITGVGETSEFKMQGGKLMYAEYGTAWQPNISPTLINDGNWHHVAVVRTATATNNVTLYVDGVLSLTGTANLTINTNTVNIGGYMRLGVLYQPFNGSIDEVRIWNRALSQAEIANNKNCELPTPTSQTGLLAYYQFNQGSDAANNAGVNSLTDSSVAVSNGALANFGLTGATSNWISGSPIATGTACSAFLSVNDYDVVTSQQFKIYPNPAHGLFKIESEFDGDFQIINQLGQTIKTFTVSANGINEVVLDNVSSGIYFIKGINGNKVVSQKLIIN
jgi:hypothetical protein